MFTVYDDFRRKYVLLGIFNSQKWNIAAIFSIYSAHWQSKIDITSFWTGREESGRLTHHLLFPTGILKTFFWWEVKGQNEATVKSVGHSTKVVLLIRYAGPQSCYCIAKQYFWNYLKNYEFLWKMSENIICLLQNFVQTMFHTISIKCTVTGEKCVRN